MMKELIPKINSAKPMISLVAKMMNKLVAERDWPAMEVSHHLLKLPLVQCSHTFVKVDCRRPDEKEGPISMLDSGNHIREFKLLYQKYCDRDSSWDDLTYFDFLSRLNHSGSNWTWFGKHAKPRVLNYFLVTPPPPPSLRTLLGSS